MIRRLNIGHVHDPIYVVKDNGTLVGSGGRLAYVLVVEQEFADPAEAQAMFRRIQARGSILDEEIDWCSGSERWPVPEPEQTSFVDGFENERQRAAPRFFASRPKRGKCHACGSPQLLDATGRVTRHVPEAQDESASSGVDAKSLLEID